MSKVITLLGSTGSIGTQSLDVCRMHGYEVFGLSANSSGRARSPRSYLEYRLWSHIISFATCCCFKSLSSRNSRIRSFITSPEFSIF